MIFIKKTIIRFSILSMVQLLTILFPLALYFILIERLSLSLIGEIATWQMIFYIIASISSYSFPHNLIPITEKLKTSNKTLKVFWNKILQIRLFVFCFVVFVIIIFYSFLPQICVFSTLLLLGKLYNPSSFFYVLSKNKLLLWFNFFTKFISLGLVFAFINQNNWYYTNLLIGVSEFFVSIIIVKMVNWPILFSIIRVKINFNFLKRERKLFFIQITIALIMMITIPITNLFFGAYIAGIVSVLEKIVSVIRGVSGNLFFTILPDFSTSKKEELLKKAQVSVSIISLYTMLIFIFSIGFIFIFKEKINQKFQVTQMFSYFLALMLVWFPIMISTPYQIFCLKLSLWESIYINAKIQLIVLILGLVILGKLLGIWGIIGSIILHEIVNLIVFRKVLHSK